ncbi:Enoyl-[acyl-carrier-protein] reductase [Durusdinium trenchii]|uniref:Mitochondrial (2-enoyl thioester reductase) (Nuclear receptor-binding factor 1) (BtNrbf-1) (NRBF-1) n=1 Tax=Durusdinium trenchii TaxID=1381693 RepID=A0ABP0RTG8_9DINO
MPQSNGIARLIDVLEDSKAYYVVMERAGGCDLYECLSGAPERRLPAHEAREVLRELLAAVAELHSHGFIHKDLKLENVMLNRPGPKCPAHIRRNLATSQGAAVKLIDFDTVEEWNSTSPKSRHVLGTDQYIAPEAYEGKYSPASDIFAVGVIAYKMLTGSFPYNGRLFDDKPGENWVGSPKMKEIKQKLCDARVSFSHPVFEKEPGASRLVARMLAVEENERPDAPETTRSGVEEPVKHLKDQDIPDNTSFQWDITATVPTRAHPKTQECTGRFHEPGRFVMETLTAVGVALGGCFAFVKFKSQPKKGQELPQKMRRLVLREANSDISQARIEVEEVDLPQPRPGQVLIKVAASPVNPSDDGTWKVPPSQGYPMPLGNEGSGVVVATGGGLLASQWLGQSVAFLGKAYAEYAVADAFLLTTVPSDVTLEDACAAIINPMTVISIVEAVRARKGTVFIHTAAASQLGQMLVRYCQQEGMVLVNLVRRKEQVDILEKLGAQYIVDTSEETWESKLQALIQQLKISHAFDCISGESTGKLLSLLPPGSTVWVYGRLAGTLQKLDPVDFIYRQKKLEGFLLTTWLFGNHWLQGLLRWRRQTKIVREGLKQTFASEFIDATLDGMLSAYCIHKASGATGAKMRVRP